MKRLKSYDQFSLNEEGGLSQLLGSVLKGDVKFDGNTFGDILSGNIKKPGTEAGFDGDTGASQTTAEDPNSGTYKPTAVYNEIPGNDDFALYMQHQQGVAGAAGIFKAFLGTGKMVPDTIATKGGVRFANLVGNIPSDEPQAKNDLIGALSKGDQRTAAAVFLNVWKKKWAGKYTQAKAAIDKPQNAEVKKAIQSACNKYGVPFDFAITVAMIESGLNPKAGNAAYKGLFAMQPNNSYDGVVTPAGNKWSDPYINAENGVKLLKHDIGVFRKQLGTDWASLKVGSWAQNMA
jgi:hypothetical protein